MSAEGTVTVEDVEEYQSRIKDIDKQMAELFEERMRNCKRIAMYDKSHGLSIGDELEKQSVIHGSVDYIDDPQIGEYYVSFLKNTNDITNQYQERIISGMKVAYSGVEGAFAYIAARKMFPTARLISKIDFHDAYSSVETGECDCVMLPLENSYAGEVSTVMDLAFNGDLYVNQVTSLKVEHYLLGIEGSKLEDIKTVISHPMALMQCSDYIRRHSFEKEEEANTALAAKHLLKLNDTSVAAIASKETAELMGLKVLDENIQDAGLNTTRFAVFSRFPDKNSSSDNSFILVFTVKNESGALAKALNIIGSHGYNMRSVRSRPMKDLMWNYYFFVEIEGNIHTPNGNALLKELDVVVGRLKLVGSF